MSLPELFSEIDPLEYDESPIPLAHERNVVGTTIGDRVLVRAGQSVARMLVDVVRYHHTPKLAPPECPAGGPHCDRRSYGELPCSGAMGPRAMT